MSWVARVADQPSLVSRSLRWVFFLSQREADWNDWSGVWSSLGSKRTPCGKKIPATTVFGCLLNLTSRLRTWIPALSSYREVNGCTRGSEAISLSLEAWWPALWMSLACEAQASRSGPRVLGFIWWSADSVGMRHLWFGRDPCLMSLCEVLETSERA